MAKTRNKRRRNKNKTPRCGFSLFGGENRGPLNPAPAPSYVPSVPNNAFPHGAQNAGEAAHKEQQQNAENQNNDNLQFQNGGTAPVPAGGHMTVPQANNHGVPDGGTSGNQNATNGVAHLAAGNANAQFDNCVGEPAGCGESQAGGSIVTKIYPTVSCFSGGVKRRKTRRKRKRKRKTTGKKSKKSHKKRRTRRHKGKKRKSKTRKKRK
jgi:hypothetical protein